MIERKAAGIQVFIPETAKSRIYTPLAPQLSTRLQRFPNSLGIANNLKSLHPDLSSFLRVAVVILEAA
jgi:hypothetical protein